MSPAYCLTCNEQVHETPSGTCPLGHPVTTADHGPEPWVGFADVEGHLVATDVDRDRDEDVPMERLDPTGRHVAHAGAPLDGHAEAGHVNGHVNGHTNGHVTSRSLLDDLERQLEGDGAGNGSAPTPAGSSADDLAALLAEALEQEERPAPEAAAEEPTTRWDTDWDELSGLAAELQLEADHAMDDDRGASPTFEASTPAPTPEASAPARAPVQPATPDLDALLAELEGQAPAEVPPAPDRAEPEPVDDVPPVAAQPPAAPPPPPPPPPVVPPAPPVADPVPATDSVPPVEDVPSPSPVDAAAGLWDDPQAGVEDTPPAPEVDLTNFTARGSRVGGGSARPARSWFRKTR